jgi:hypothetical protein
MRPWYIVLLLFLPILMTTPALSQEVTFTELNGATVESRIVRAQTEEDWRGNRYSGKLQSDVKFIIGPGDLLQGTQTITWHRPDGSTAPSIVLSGSGRLGKPKANREAGGGYSVSVFMNGTFTYLRTFKKGAFKATFKFARFQKGFACTATEKHLREKGAERISLNSVRDGRPLVIVNSRMISSSCRVTRP